MNRNNESLNTKESISNEVADGSIFIIPNRGIVNEDYENENNEEKSGTQEKNSKRKVISSSSSEIVKKTKTSNSASTPVIIDRSQLENEEEEEDDENDNSDSETEGHLVPVSSLSKVILHTTSADVLPFNPMDVEDPLFANLNKRSSKKPRAHPREWSLHYAALVEYAKEHGHANIPKKDVYECDIIGAGSDGENYHYIGNLGKWLNSQRQAKKGNHKKMKFTADMEAQLQILVDSGHLLWDASSLNGIGKSKQQAEINWPRHFAALLEYYKEYGTCNVPGKKTYECTLVGMGENGEDYHYNGKLGQWLCDQRLSKKGKRTKTLTPEREAQFQQLVNAGKLLWDPLLPNWPRNYAALQEYYKEHGTCNVPSKGLYECTLKGMGPEGGDYQFIGNLGKWLCDQRLAKKGLGGAHLTPERDALLQILVDEGKLLWDASAFSCTKKSAENGDVTWPRHYAALLEYYKEHGTCNVPYTWSYECILPNMSDENGGDYHYRGKLGLWLHHQRSTKNGIRKEKIRADREELLQQLVNEGKLVWESYTVATGATLPPVIPWKHHFAAMLEYCKEHGTCNVPAKVRSYECTLVGMGEQKEDVQYVGNLGKWVGQQRRASRRTSGKILKPDRVIMFQQLVDEGKFTWESPYVTALRVAKQEAAADANTSNSNSSSANSMNKSNKTSANASMSNKKTRAVAIATTSAADTSTSSSSSSSSNSSSSSTADPIPPVRTSGRKRNAPSLIEAAAVKTTATTSPPLPPSHDNDKDNHDDDDDDDDDENCLEEFMMEDDEKDAADDDDDDDEDFKGKNSTKASSRKKIATEGRERKTNNGGKKGNNGNVSTTSTATTTTTTTTKEKVVDNSNEKINASKIGKTTSTSSSSSAAAPVSTSSSSSSLEVMHDLSSKQVQEEEDVDNNHVNNDDNNIDIIIDNNSSNDTTTATIPIKPKAALKTASSLQQLLQHTNVKPTPKAAAAVPTTGTAKEKEKVGADPAINLSTTTATSTTAANETSNSSSSSSSVALLSSSSLLQAMMSGNQSGAVAGAENNSMNSSNNNN